jgi:hypothetical protein
MDNLTVDYTPNTILKDLFLLRGHLEDTIEREPLEVIAFQGFQALEVDSCLVIVNLHNRIPPLAQFERIWRPKPERRMPTHRE